MMQVHWCRLKFPFLNKTKNIILSNDTDYTACWQAIFKALRLVCSICALAWQNKALSSEHVTNTDRQVYVFTKQPSQRGL